MKSLFVFLNIVLFYWILDVGYAQSQSMMPEVINTTGGDGTDGNVYINYNIGETFVETISNSNHIITQGFLQPDLGPFNLIVTHSVSSISCVGKNDGFIILQKYHTGTTPQNLNYVVYWSNNVCPTNNCEQVYNLSPGTYSVLIVAYNGTKPIDSVVVSNITIAPSSIPCKIKVYTYISPNNDGTNDFLYVENIEEYPNNQVYIFNRWGQQILHIQGYNNADKAWGKKDFPIQVPPGTYYYLIDLDGQNKQIVKGFLEIIKE